MVKIEITPAQLKTAIKRLSLEERSKLIEELSRSTWQQRFDQLLSRIDARVKRHPLSQREINQIIKEVRKELYDKNQHRR